MRGLTRTNIDWCDFSWPVITGCDNRMECFKYCYARSVHKRFLLSHPWYNTDFSYKFNDYILKAPIDRKIPSIIFIGSMGEWWHPDVPLSDQVDVIDVVNQCPQHKFICLTKQIGILRDMVDFWWADFLPGIDEPRWNSINPGEILPKNLWVGTTISTRKDLGRLLELQDVRHSNKLISFEPLLEDVGSVKGFSLKGIGWVIIGAQTGPGGRQPENKWVSQIINRAKIDGEPPILVKKNLDWPKKWGDRMVKFPEGFP